jgi:DNA-binding FadR family transcriptional regulator
MASPDSVDRRKVYVRIADELRRDLAAGRFVVGEPFPPIGELAERFGAAKATVERALDILRGERLIASRQGSRTIVEAVPDAPADADADPERSEEFDIIFAELQKIRGHVEQLAAKLKELDERTQDL